MIDGGGLFSLGPSIFGGLAGLGKPDTGGNFLDSAAFAPRATVERPSSMASVSGVASGAAGGAVAGTSVSPGWGTLIGGVLGGVSSLFSPKAKDQSTPTAGTGSSVSSGSNEGLLGAFTKGLASVVPGFSGGGGVPVTQNQTNSQTTNLNVSNVLGGAPFAGTDASGNFDTFRAIADVFKIKDAQAAADAAAVNSGGYSVTAVPTAKKVTNYLPYVIGGSLIIAVYLSTKK